MFEDKSPPIYCNTIPDFKYNTEKEDRHMEELERRGEMFSKNASPRTLEKAEQVSDIIRNGLQELQISAYRPKVQKDDIETMKERTLEFMKRKLEAKQLPTMEGLAAWFGVTRSVLAKWASDPTDEKVYEFLNVVSEVFSSMWAESAQNGSTNSVAWIFYAKNHFGYVDKKEVNFNASVDNADAPNADDIRKRWLLENGKDVEQDDEE